MTYAEADRAGLLARALDWIKARLAHDQELATLAQFDLDYMAADLGVTHADLQAILPRDADNSLLMDRMVQARGLDPDALRAAGGSLLRDVELTCARCASTRRCRHELAAGTAAANGHAFCGNATTFDEILEG